MSERVTGTTDIEEKKGGLWTMEKRVGVRVTGTKGKVTLLTSLVFSCRCLEGGRVESWSIVENCVYDRREDGEIHLMGVGHVSAQG